jgi:hypothetical protein
MGIYIESMNMPTTCGKCKIKNVIECDRWKLVRSVVLDRHKECPLIPVPEHGDLIERDKLAISTAVSLDGSTYKYVHIDNIKCAPIIISASQEDK